MIKSFNLRDLLLVANLQKQGTTLNLEERLIDPHSPLNSALAASLFPAMSRVSTYILNVSDKNESYRGLAQTRTRPGRPEEDIIFMSPTLAAGDGSLSYWQRLLNHVCIKAGEAGHHRVYTRLDGQGDEIQLFKNIGFTPYAEELIFRLDKPFYHPPANNNPLQLRKQTNADSWSLQRLYAAVTPHGAQIAEGLAQGQWQVGEYSLRRYGYVWESQGEILAVMSFHSGKLGHWFRLLIHPDVREEAANLIESGLFLLKNHNQQPVYCSLRTYQSELVVDLVDFGFEEIASQLVLVKHITVRAKDFLSRLIPAFDKVVEAKPASPSSIMQVETTTGQHINGKPKRTSGPYPI